MRRFIQSYALFAIIGVIVADVVLARQLSALWILPLAVFTVLPGRLLLYIIERKHLSYLSTLLYSFGLGLFMLMITGLVLNLVIHTVTHGSALASRNILLAIHTELLLLGVTCFLLRARKSSSTKPRAFIVPSRFDILSLALSSLLVLISVGSVNVLNNGGSNKLALVSIGLCAILPIYVVASRKKISLWSYASVLFSISLALLFLTSLRSHYLVGSDVLNEFQVAQIVAGQRFWSISQIATTYNACVSITILPQMLHAVTGQDTLQLFRSGFQVLFSISAILMYCIARQYLKPITAFLASITFIGFINYNGSMPNHIRQEISLLFFMLIILVILSHELSRIAQRILVIVFAFAMVISHYSTSYVAIIIFLAAACTPLVLGWWQKYRKTVAAQAKSLQDISIMNLRMVCVIILFVIFWYSQIIPSSGGPLAYIKTVGKNLLANNIDNQQAQQTGLSDQFNLFYKPGSQQALFASYIKSNSVVAPGYEPRLIAQPVTKPQLQPKALNGVIRFLAELAKKIYKFLAIGGMFLLLWYAWRRRKPYGNVYVELLVGCVVTIGVSFVVPSFTVNYDQERLFQQLLVLLAVPFILFAELLLRRFNHTISYSIIVVFLGFYMLTSTSFMGQITGGVPLPLQLNDQGTDYNRYYVHTSEIAAAVWMKKVHRYQPIYADSYAQNRINFAGGGLHVDNKLSPSNMAPGAYTYYDYGNVTDNLTYQPYKNGLLILNTPTDYLQANTNLIYANGGSAVYAKH